MFRGRFSDGTSAVGLPVFVRVEDAGLRILPREESDETPAAAGPALPRHGLLWRWDALTSSAPLLPDENPLLSHRDQPDARLFIIDPDIVPELTRHAPDLSARAHRRRMFRSMLAATALAIGLLAWLLFSDTSIARFIARALPQSLHDSLGASLVTGLSKGKHCDSSAGLSALHILVDRLSADAPPARRRRVFVARLGMINAITTPGGYIVMGEELIKFAKSPDEVAGVLAHEMGHAARMHPEAALVRTFGIMIVFDMTFGTGWLGQASALLTQLHFSRQAEREADRLSMRLMRRAGADPAALADFFRRLQEKHKDENDTPDLFRTHPPTAERIRLLERERTPATPILKPAQWRALRAICDHQSPIAPALRSGR